MSAERREAWYDLDPQAQESRDFGGVRAPDGRFFRRCWTSSAPPLSVVQTPFGEAFQLNPHPLGLTVWIYGYELVQRATDYDEPEEGPHPIMDMYADQIFGRFYSVLCPDGELGYAQPSQQTEITREEFLAAGARGWVSA